jgi:pyruvate dehydrogenase E2 component (dihydrolipoamide acetyltransferase)
MERIILSSLRRVRSNGLKSNSLSIVSRSGMTCNLNTVASNTLCSRNTSNIYINNTLLKKSLTKSNSMRFMSTYPEHTLHPMPALSPTMETGSIAKWNIQEGDFFAVGQPICEVETDKATVTYDATDEGYLAKILVGSGEVKVGDPLMVTVEDKDDVSSFTNFSAGAGAEVVSTVISQELPVEAPKSVAALTASVPSYGKLGDRVIASPFARKIAREALFDISTLNGKGTGSNGRIVADDVMLALANKSNAPAAVPTTTTTTTTTVPVSTTKSENITINTSGVNGVYQDFELSNISQGNYIIYLLLITLF